MTYLVNAQTGERFGATSEPAEDAVERLRREGWRVKLREGRVFVVGHRQAHVRRIAFERDG